jgi:hypothetical protein
MNQYMVALVGASDDLYPHHLKEKMASSNLFDEAVFGYRDGGPIPKGLGNALFAKVGATGIVFQGESGRKLIESPNFMINLQSFLEENNLAKGFTFKNMELSLARSNFPILYRARSMVIARTLEKQVEFKAMTTDEKLAYLEHLITRDIESYAARYGIDVLDDLNVRVDPESAEQKLSYFKHKKTKSGGHTTLTLMRDLRFSCDARLNGYWAIGRVRTNGNGRVAYVY